MAAAVKHKEVCRLCQGRKLELVLPIAASPIGDAFVTRSELGREQECYPLDLYLCLDCGHMQNVDVVDPDVLFRDYLYVTSSSASLVAHFRQYAGDVAERFGLEAGSLVVEIGSNDGSLLGFFKERGCRVLGIDPARSIAEDATRRGIPTLPEFFTESLAEKVRGEHGAAALVAANNVFAHADDLVSIARGIRRLLADDGVFVFEVSYLVDIVDRFLFDTVYHEHVSYHSIAPLQRFFHGAGLELFDVQRIASKGGSLRGFAQRRPEGRRPLAPVVGELVRAERERGFHEPAIYRRYADAIAERKAALQKLVRGARAAGKRIAGYGASTTVTTLTWHFELADALEFLADDNPRKHGMFSPRAHTPVLPSEELYTRRPDYVIILAWNYAQAILQRHQRFVDEGGMFVIPLPELRVVGRHAE